MNFHLPNPLNLFRPKPAHVEPRWHAATKAENLAAQQKRTDVRLELAVYAATTTPEQRKAEAERFHEQSVREWQAQRRAAERRRAS
jgi:hypothetical protein